MDVESAALLLIALSALYVPIALVLLISRRSRKFAFRSGLLSLVVAFGAAALYSLNAERKATAAGFDSAQDKRDAERAGISLPEIWRQQRTGQLAKWRAEEAASAAAKEQDCVADEGCFTKRYEVDARQKCQPALEAYAKFDLKWSIEPFFFSAYVDRREGTIRYSGNSLQLQNGFGTWQRYRYECLYSFRLEQLVTAIINER